MAAGALRKSGQVHARRVDESELVSQLRIRDSGRAAESVGLPTLDKKQQVNHGAW